MCKCEYISDGSGGVRPVPLTVKSIVAFKDIGGVIYATKEQAVVSSMKHVFRGYERHSPYSTYLDYDGLVKDWDKIVKQVEAIRQST